MHPPATPSGWLLGAAAQFDALTDLADDVIARLAGAARDGDASAVDEIADIRRRMRTLDGLDDSAVAALATKLTQRAMELAS